MVKKAHLVTGKGGVGKSLFSVVLAHYFSIQNKQTLLCELSEHSFFRDYLNLPEITYKPLYWKPNLDISQWSPDDCLKEYCLHFLKIESLYKLFFENPVSKSLIQIAPGLHELALLGKMTSSPRKQGPPMKHDQIVIDAFATGHFLNLLRAPGALNEAIPFGPLGEQAKSIDECIRNPDFTEVHIVTLAEELPITESIELFQQLKKEFGINAKIYLNKISGLVPADIADLTTEAQDALQNTLMVETAARSALKKSDIRFIELPLVTSLDVAILIKNFDRLPEGFIMIELLPNTKTLICIGSGGVGKTTMAASLGTGFANSGKKILVLTIDPSLRLAQALGIKTDGEIHRVQLAADALGELWSCVIDHKKTFEWFVRSAAGNADVGNLLKNRLYQQLSGRLSGSQEFTSLISLYRFVSSKEYDLVILDTPPSQHTWSFLRAPEKISALFNEGVASWFRQPSAEKKGVLKRILSSGTTQVLKALETMTGSFFMKELSAFFQAIQRWQGPLEEYVMSCHRLLVSADTEFILITALDSSRITEAQKLSREIQKQGYRLTSVIINRIPVWTHSQKSTKSVRIAELIKYYESLENDLQSRLNQFKNSLKVYKCFELRQNSEDVKGLQKNFDHINSVS